MPNWRNACITPNDSLLTALRTINDEILIALVVDAEERFIGTVTDGDIRRALLAGRELSEPVANIMSREPVFFEEKQDPQTILSIMRQKGVKHIPVLNRAGKILYVESFADILEKNRKDNQVLIMAGGLGTRLYPLTEDCPKPMLRIKGKPILEIIIENLISHGFHRFLVSVNYKAEMIEEYFQNGMEWGVEIDYLREDRRLGTAGALSLLPEKPNLPLLVMNGDVISHANFSHLLKFHGYHDADAVMCLREYSIEVPFGVVELEHEHFIKIVEKPVHTHFINAGIYVLNPDIPRMVPKNEFFDMPSLFNLLKREQKKLLVYPISDFWLDVGNKDDLEKAIDFSETCPGGE